MTDEERTRLEQIMHEARRARGLNPDGTRSSVPPPAASALASLTNMLASPSESDLTFTCPTCGTVVPPVPFDTRILGIRMRQGSCPNGCKPPAVILQEESEARTAAAERERRLARYKALFPFSHMGADLQAATLDNFTVRPGSETALQQARHFAEALPSPKPPGLIIWGTQGNGKSHLGAAIARAAREKGLAVAWLDLPEWLPAVGGMEIPEREDLLRTASRADLLVMDELAGGNLTAARVGYILHMIRHRYKHRLPLVITTNLSLGELEVALSRRDEESPVQSQDGERIVDRLVELCQIVENRAPSYRQERAVRRRTGQTAS